MLGFVRWLFRDCYKNAQFWGFSTVVLALVATLSGCPDPIPWYMSLVGISISFIDFTISMISYSYDLYKLEQNRIARELSRK